MSIIKSFGVGNGDMFYIDHNSDNFTIIDCCLSDDNEAAILAEIANLNATNGIVRFISTHPDDDHMRGLDKLDDKIKILNFYCVYNQAVKENETDCFTRYCELRDSKKAYYLKKGCSRKWMNVKDDERGSAGLNVLWPDLDSQHFKDALAQANEGGSPNNISPIIRYMVDGGVTALWMGDLETEYLEAIEDELALPKVDLLFAPHHGRDSAKVPVSLLEKMEPQIIIIGEAPCEYLNYYKGYNTITQNTAGDIVFDCGDAEVDVYTECKYTANFLSNRSRTRKGWHYAGTLDVG